MGEGRDPLRYFRVEARELVDQITAGVLDLDQQPGAELISRLLRYAHTLKGAARVVRQPEIADRAHAFEEVLIGHRGADDPLPADDMRELLRLNDEIAGCVSQLAPAAATGGTPVAADRPEPGDPVTADQPPAEPTDPTAATEPAPRTPTADLDELLDAIGEASARLAPLREGGRTLSRLCHGAENLAERLHAGRARLDEATGRHHVQRLADELGSLQRRFADAIDQVEREIDEIRGRAEGLRLVAAGTIFTALHRAARDAADARGLRVRFVGRGADVRMGPHLLNSVANAFGHVVRNAVVHGIEPEPERLAAGKPPEGTVTVEVERRGRHAIFRCVDDGRGFDLTAVRAAAAERGLLPPGGAEPDPQQLVDMVLAGGVSTSAAVTEVAGRGIGMDVARDAAARLRGEISIRTRPGVGTTVELTVPLALLSMNGLVVEAGDTVATIPLDAVRRCVRLTSRDAADAAATGRLPYDGQVVPFLPLTVAIAAGSATAAADPPEAATKVVVMVRADEQTAAIGVDRLAGTTTLVARPLPELAPAAPVIGSVTIDRDGNPRLVLDPHGLVAQAQRGYATAHAPSAAPQRTAPILVIDDSLTTRMLERSILESAGYEVELAASGEQGLTMARSRRYGLFLTDIDMPGIDGFTFVARTRADPELADIPAILVSSRDLPEDRARGAEVGADAYVVKGEFDQQELLGHIRRLIHS